jgi:tetratricopeptide (TPR) repeat protein
MSLCLSETALLDYARSALDGTGAPEHAEHVAQCPRCRGLLSALARAQPPDDPGSLAPLTTEGVDPSTEPLPPLGPGTRFGKYTVEALIGRGSAGVVYRAKDPTLQRDVALKLLPQAARGPWLEEARAMARVRSPHCVTVYEADVVDERPFLAMEWMEGGTLRQWWRTSKPSVTARLRTLLQAGQGLAALHAEGLVHRDFKPDNVLLAKDGRACVADLGLSRGAQSSAPASVAGTPGYMAPEQHHGQADARSDQFAFCASLYEALTGARPPRTATFAVDPDALGAAPRGVPRKVWSALERGLREAPAERHPSMEALLGSLRPPRRTLRWVAAGALVSGTVAVAAAWALPNATWCETAEQSWSGVWTPARKATLAARFQAASLPYAGQSWATVQALLDGHARTWQTLFDGACPAQTLRLRPNAKAELQLACLAQRALRTRALLDSFETPGAIERAVSAVTALPHPAECADVASRGALASDEATNAPVRGQLARAEAALATGDFKAGEALARQTVEAAQRSGSPALHADALRVLGTLQEKNGDYAGSRATLEKAAQVAEAGREDAVLVRAATQLVRTVGVMQARWSDAEPWASKAHEALARLGGNPLLQAELLRQRGSALQIAGKYHDALESQQASLALRWPLLGELHVDTAASLDGVALALVSVGRFDEAKAQHRRSLDIRQAVLGVDHPDTAASLNNLGNTFSDSEDFAEALELHRRSYTLKARALGPSHLSTLRSRMNLAVDLKALGRLDEAASELEAVLAVLTAPGASRAPLLAKARNVYGDVLLLRGKLGEAKAQLLQARVDCQAVYGPSHPLEADVLDSLGELALRTRSFAEARGHYEQALSLREGTLGSASEELVSSLAGLALAEKGLGHSKRGAALAERATTLCAGPGCRPSARALATRALAAR